MKYSSIEDANIDLKEKSSCMKIEARGDKLSLRGTLPTESGNKQKRFALNVTNNADGLAHAVDIATRITELVRAGLFKLEYLEWATIPSVEDLTPSSLSVDVSAISTEFKAYLNVAPATWSKAYLPYIKKIHNATSLHASLEGKCLAAINSYDIKSRSRQTCITTARKLHEFLGLPCPNSIEMLPASYSPSDVKDRIVPSKQEIEAQWNRIPNHQWKNAFALMAVFGIRNHEIFRSEVVTIDGKVFCRVSENTKTGRRICLPYWPEWVELFGIAPRLDLPNIDCDCNQRVGQQVALQFNRYDIGFKPYDLRHAYAIRTIANLPDFLVAKSLGHSVEALNRIYRKHFNDSNFVDAAAGYIS